VSDDRGLLKDARQVVGILLNEDARYHVSVGGNPIAVDRMVGWASDLLIRLDAAILATKP